MTIKNKTKVADYFKSKLESNKARQNNFSKDAVAIRNKYPANIQMQKGELSGKKD